MLFSVLLSQSDIDIVCDILLSLQEDLLRNIRLRNRMKTEKIGPLEAEEAMLEINKFNERQVLLKKLALSASEDFRKKLRPNDLMLWEELPPEEKGLTESREEETGQKEEGKSEENARYRIYRIHYHSW